MRKIHCRKCGAYLGEIRDATIRKGTEYICPECCKPKKADLPPGFEKLFGGIIDPT